MAVGTDARVRPFLISQQTPNELPTDLAGRTSHQNQHVSPSLVDSEVDEQPL
jgi:hypothetical protein